MNQHFSKLLQLTHFHAPRSWVRAVEICAIGLWVVAGSWSAVELGRAIVEVGRAAWLPLALAGALGWLVADALSGAVHYFADNFGAPEWPILGPALIVSFRDHHDAPLGIVSHDVVERSGMVCLAAFVLGGWVGPFLNQSEATTLHVSVGALALSAATWISWTGEFHAWAHGLPAPRCGKLLQGLGVVLSPTRHALHHAGSHSSHYCITSGFWDRLLARSPKVAVTDSSPPLEDSGA